MWPAVWILSLLNPGLKAGAEFSRPYRPGLQKKKLHRLDELSTLKTFSFTDFRLYALLTLWTFDFMDFVTYLLIELFH
ncbi:MAG: hypothetical protein A2W91_02365 [Bacteroidetes bacterium GWF2_38_335]|nr:MAG: hypothetical protein A2W91_02365 [Bacteroidetes bacterium GWF2_38_335]OFY80692.1 MAG: hypothetical protein A2281_05380 [Bacteroidetes bacterium RIFOXYA12_FULL_38_20]HBS87039.1 hypothetical protein [Bacteroidales bacterium]